MARYDDYEDDGDDEWSYPDYQASQSIPDDLVPVGAETFQQYPEDTSLPEAAQYTAGQFDPNDLVPLSQSGGGIPNDLVPLDQAPAADRFVPNDLVPLNQPSAPSAIPNVL
jgi:hypothetical protein